MHGLKAASSRSSTSHVETPPLSESPLDGIPWTEHALEGSRAHCTSLLTVFAVQVRIQHDEQALAVRTLRNFAAYRVCCP
eukprot:659291-Rhodomonas_salina.2